MIEVKNRCNNKRSGVNKAVMKKIELIVVLRVLGDTSGGIE